METANVSTGSESQGAINDGAESAAEEIGAAGGHGMEADIGESGASDQTPSHQQQMKELTDEYMDHMVKLKINGKEVRKPLKEVIRLNQLEQASQEKLNQAAQARRELKQRQMREQQMVQLAKEDPFKFAQVVGVDPAKLKQLMIDRLANEYDLQQMSPEQREAAELKEWKKQRELEDQQRAEQEKRTKAERLQAQHSVLVDKEIGEALKTSNLPKNKLFVQRVAHAMVESIERVKAGLDENPLRAADAVAKVKEGWISDVRDTIGTMDAKAIHELLGPETLKKIRAFDVERVTGRKVETRESDSRPSNQEASGKPEMMNEFERRKYIADLKRKLPS